MGALLAVALFGSGLVLGAVGVYALQLPALRDALRRAELANDRLVQAWKDGYTVPSIADGPREVVPAKPLPKNVEEFLDQWDDEGRAHWTALARRYEASGYSGDGILHKLQTHVA